MTRSHTRGIFIDRKMSRLHRILTKKEWPILMAKYLQMKSRKLSLIKAQTITLYRKSGVITKRLLGLTFLIHTGMSFQRIIIEKGMLGFKFGEFILTKRLGAFIHRDNKLAKKKQNNSNRWPLKLHLERIKHKKKTTITITFSFITTDVKLIVLLGVFLKKKLLE